MMKHINYRRVFNEPYKIYTAYGDFSVSVFMLFIIVLSICIILFKYVPVVYYPIKYLAYALPGGYIYVYGGIPLLICLFIIKINKDGKRIYMFLLDYMKWYLFIKISQCLYYHDNKLLYIDKNIIIK